MRLRPRYADVVSTLALLLVLSGGAYAATQLPKNSVASKQIKNNTVKSADLKNGGVKAKDIRAGELAKGLAGTPMGGDLSGTFPNPTLDPDVLADVVRDDDLQGYVDQGDLDAAIAAALDEGVLLGDRTTDSELLAAGAGELELVSLPGVVSVYGTCFQAGPNRGMNVRITNETAASDWDYVLRQQEQAPVDSDDISSGELGAGDDLVMVFPPDDATQTARYAEITVFSGSPLTVEIAGITSNLAGDCWVRASAQLDDGPS